MGMFDYVQSEVPLPDGYTGELQTKSLDCLLTTVLIRADGRLLIKDQEFEEVPVSERPFPNDPRKRFIGSMRVTQESWRDLNFHGDIEIYGYERDAEEWHGYVARFTHGQLEYIKDVPANYGVSTSEPIWGEEDRDGDDGVEPRGRSAPTPDDTLNRLRLSGADQAKALREQVRKGGLRFEAYLPPNIAEWLLDMIERDVFTDPSEAVSVILREHMELQPHTDLRDELLRRSVQAAMGDPRPSLSVDDVLARLEERIGNPSEPAVWAKRAHPSGDGRS